MNTNFYGFALPKWPQMIVTGRSVTEAQAKEIIFRTDSFFTSPSEFSGGNFHEFNQQYKIDSGLSYISEVEDVWEYSNKVEMLRKRLGILNTAYVKNTWGSCAFIYGPSGWCHPTGKIEYFYNVGKWPNVETIFSEWTDIATAFPFLDLNVTLMSGEECEKNTTPVLNIRVVNGAAKLENPYLLIHHELNIPNDSILDNISELVMRDVKRELGLPTEWYSEFAIKVHTAMNELGFIPTK